LLGGAAADSAKDAGALPLLSYLLDDMWTKMVERGDGVLRLPPGAIELGRVLVERANTFLADRPKSEDQLRRIFTLKLATVREDGEPIHVNWDGAQAYVVWLSRMTGAANRLLTEAEWEYAARARHAFAAPAQVSFWH
jgi:Sulfatase-modifying factor enzyme 1